MGIIFILPRIELKEGVFSFSLFKTVCVILDQQLSISSYIHSGSFKIINKKSENGQMDKQMTFFPPL